MSSSQGAPRKGKKKALLVAVRRVNGFPVSSQLRQAHSDAQELKQLLISKYDYAEENIVVLLDDRSLQRSFWPDWKNILRKIKWLVKDIGEHDRLVFYYSGHGGQTTCHHGSEEDGKDEAIYGYDGVKIIDNDLKKYLVNPVLKIKGCQLFALFDCCHSETVLDLTHGNCSSRLLPEVRSSTTTGLISGADVAHVPVTNKWWRLAPLVGKALQSKGSLLISPSSIIEHANRTLGRLCNRIGEILKGLLHGTSPVDGSMRPSAKPRVSINTAIVSHTDSIMSPHRTVISPISIIPNAVCNHTCAVTKTEDNEGHVVCISACRDSERTHDDDMAGGTLTKVENNFDKVFSFFAQEKSRHLLPRLA